MKIIARLRWGCEATVKRLADQDIKARLIKGGVVVELPSYPTRHGMRYRIVEQTQASVLSIDVAEKGGLGDPSKRALVVCGFEGEPLFPYYRPRRVASCGESAYFSFPYRILTVTCTCDELLYNVWFHEIKANGREAWIESGSLSDGEVKVVLLKCSCGAVLQQGMEKQDHLSLQNGKRCKRPQFRPYGLPNKFFDAIMAAREKAKCRGCQHVHFAK